MIWSPCELRSDTGAWTILTGEVTSDQTLACQKAQYKGFLKRAHTYYTLDAGILDLQQWCTENRSDWQGQHAYMQVAHVAAFYGTHQLTESRSRPL